MALSISSVKYTDPAPSPDEKPMMAQDDSIKKATEHRPMSPELLPAAKEPIIAPIVTVSKSKKHQHDDEDEFHIQKSSKKEDLSQKISPRKCDQIKPSAKMVVSKKHAYEGDSVDPKKRVKAEGFGGNASLRKPSHANKNRPIRPYGIAQNHGLFKHADDRSNPSYSKDKQNPALNACP